MSDARRSLSRRLADALVERWVGRAYLEEFMGDLEEIYEDRREEKGKFIAEGMYWVDAIHLIFGFSSTASKQSHSMFIGNMVKIAWRSAARHKQFTILNLLGLTLGIATCVAIGLYVYEESTYDTFHSNGDRIYRINQPMIWGDWTEQFSGTGPGITEAIRTDIPDFEQVTRIYFIGEQLTRVTDNGEATNFNEENFYAAEDNFFKVFTFPFLKGDPNTALKDPNTVVITASTAKRYFGDEDPMGKLIETKSSTGTYTPYTVTGVLADVPAQSHLKFDMLSSLTSVEQFKDGKYTWIWTIFGTYGLVREGTDVAALTKKLQALPPKWAGRTTQSIFNQTFEQFTKGQPWTLYMQPLRDIYLASEPGFNRFGPQGNPKFVMIFGAIGALVLLLSSINFMNLSTARSSNRAKEVGVRKVLGSAKTTLVRQFIIESVLYVAVSTVAALVLVQLSLNAFNTIAEKQLSLVTHLTNPYFFGTLIGFILIVGLAAGSYPSLYLSAFKPAETLKGKLKSGFKGSGIRNALVVFQFTVSIALIICTFFVQKQLAYTSTIDVGISKDHVLQIYNIHQLGKGVDVLKAKLQTNPAFTAVAQSGFLPPNVWAGDRYRAEGPDQPVVDLHYMRCDENYLPLLETKFLLGRNFDPANAADKYNIIINEEAARILGYGSKETWADNSPLGKHVVQSFGSEEKLQIIGVVKDFNFNSVKLKIEPLIVMHTDNDKHWSYSAGFPCYLSMRLNPASIKSGDELQSIIDNVKTEVAKVDPAVPFQYSFMDEEFDNTFHEERKMSVILNLFTALAIAIACLGLFGLAAFSADQRKKELGIRKLHGASTGHLVFLFSSEFTKLVGVSIILATPIAYFLTDYWLSNFAYRTPISVLVFVAAAVTALSIAIFTVGFQSLSAANANPAEVLKNE
ncbi:ABC transporter permease [Chryseolinea sp. T2]|uniref:ABC transporter permease n=1 Tax=Chryseolinea sp. T2 TaxID=3129255 RepID=UPI00307807BB